MAAPVAEGYGLLTFIAALGYSALLLTTEALAAEVDNCATLFLELNMLAPLLEPCVTFSAEVFVFLT